MKIKFSFSAIQISLVCVALLVLSSCTKDFPGNVESDRYTILKSIKILNAGENGDEVVEGVINDTTKMVTFPRVHKLTDVDNIRFEVVVSDGAKIDKETYSFPFQEGDSDKSIILKVLNEKRYREYLVTLGLRVPGKGADFSKGVVYDYSNNPIGNPLYPDYVSMLTRGGAFDGEYVLVPTRNGGTKPHLLKVEDLKNNRINKIPLNVTGVTGGTLAIQTGAFVNGNLYVFNVSSTAAGFKMYFYKDYKNNYDKPPVIVEVPVAGLALTGGRVGENTSVNLDANGNGYIFMPDNATKNIFRLKIANYTQVLERSILPLPSSTMTFSLSFNGIGGEQYLTTSYGAPMYIVSDGAAISSTVSETILEKSAADARVVVFNKERYLIYITAGINASSATVFKVYNITRGNSVEDAMAIFNELSELERKPVYEFSLNGGANTAPISHTSFAVEKDEDGRDSKLLLYATATDAGFSIFEFPVKILE